MAENVNVSSGNCHDAISAAVRSGHGAGHTTDFLFEEWEEVVDAWGVVDPDDYQKVPRLGRKIRLGQNQRETAWEVFSSVRSHLMESGLVTWADAYAELSHRLQAGEAFPYTHVVVDEAQDLSVAQAKFLGKLGQAQDDALFFAGDLGQRIFHLPFSWCRLGIDVRGRSKVLKVCYRTSHQIRSVADRLLSNEIVDQDGVTESRRGTVSVFDGPAPDVDLFESLEDERVAVRDWLSRMTELGIDPIEIGVLVRDAQQPDRAKAAASEATGVQVMTMHDAKGLEFRAVAVMALDEDVVPSAHRLAEVGDLADLEAIHDTERHLLYVAATRARDHLYMSGLRPGSEFLDDLDLSG
ncbi:3'-5' exonuclease [Sphingomicrobium astaxanthinifaciens]|uniref:3'-5' exonuclease n=1 Tax=Sphingomicrobium astaxanthinifaciens TaxID=1227949 RepID=UPI001FCB2D6F|nr:3'-5' exonuclease [Sphingomicrobium astaxanthinifaciens]MCJ7420438.1 UvrD-helicase domain-containing protein [Sphingomicrobium astaxanthinifaciens]